MEDIRSGIVGSGGMACSHAAAFDELEGVRICAIAARNQETGSSLAEQYGVPLDADWESLLRRDDLDAVAICTNNDSHGPISIGAVEAGKHVFAEYPLARRIEEADHLIELTRESQFVFRVTHRGLPTEIHAVAAELGPLLEAVFVRLTPGRGRRPETLFNLNISGPPALFFIYQIFGLVELFGQAKWVDASCHYSNLSEDGGYQRFVNSTSVEFARGGLAQWTWAGGIEIEEAEEYQRFVFERGSLLREDGNWLRSGKSGTDQLKIDAVTPCSLHETFLNDIRTKDGAWRDTLSTAYDAVKISLGAERSMLEEKRIFLH